jgi:ketosteroid isomerase-like protein
MGTEANRAIITEMYAAAQRGDLQSFFAAMSPDLVVVEPRFLPYGGTYRGIDGLQLLMGEVTKILDMGALKVKRVIADGDHVLGFITVPLLAKDSEVELLEYSILRDGKVVEIRLFFHDLGTFQLHQATSAAP